MLSSILLLVCVIFAAASLLGPSGLELRPKLRGVVAAAALACVLSVSTSAHAAAGDVAGSVVAARHGGPDLNGITQLVTAIGTALAAVAIAIASIFGRGPKKPE